MYIVLYHHVSQPGAGPRGVEVEVVGVVDGEEVEGDHGHRHHVAQHNVAVHVPQLRH